MPRFRPRLTQPLAASPDLLAVGQIIDALMQPGHFFVAPSLHLCWSEAAAEEVPWEVFRGRLLDRSQTRQRGRFLAWHITEEGADTPLLSVRLDVNAGVVHVTRGILCYVWEGYDSGGGVILSREVQRWTTELVGSAVLDRFPDADELRDELACLIWQAIVGTSRLPLHSVEAPLPAFSLGQLHYVYRSWAGDVQAPMCDWRTLLDAIERPELCHRERARALELVLRHIEDQESLLAVASYFSCRPQDALQLLRTVFNDVSLSPYTRFLDTVSHFLFELLRPFELPLHRETHADFLGRRLRQLSRHLTAYDLITFHHRGANYPDGLLLEIFLHDYAGLIYLEQHVFTGADDQSRLRCRALRQACLLHRHYDRHLVPDRPTSPGENIRVLPAPHLRVPEEQLLQPHRRQRRMFVDNLADWFDLPSYRATLVASLGDLHCPAERTELGIGLFIDRPLGYGKEAGEPDYTPLLAHEAFSLSIARQRLKELAMLAQELGLEVPADLFDSVERMLEETPVRGIPAEQLAEPTRPTACLADVRRVADDFVIVRTLPGGLGEMLDLFDITAVQARYNLSFLREGQRPRVVANVRTPRGDVLGFFDDEYRCELEAVVDLSAGFATRAGVEFPVAGLGVVAVRGEDVRAAGMHIPLKSRELGNAASGAKGAHPD
jgi:hypothetical protein